MGKGVCLSELNRPDDGMTLGELLGEGLVFRKYDGTNWGGIFPNSDDSTVLIEAVAVKCPHEMENNKCKYCGFVCAHSSGYTDGKCKTCGTPCPHANVNETTYKCSICDMQMVIKTETKSGIITYGTDLTTAMNAAEGGETFTLLNNTSLSKNVNVCGIGKTVTLNLNGYSVGSDAFAFHVGKTEQGGTLAIVGKGDILTTLNVLSSGTIDLSGWAGGKIGCLSLEKNVTVTGNIPGEADIEELLLRNFDSGEVDLIKLSDGSYGRIFWSNFDEAEIKLSLGSLLAPGYAFVQGEQFVSYTTKLNRTNAALKNVKVVECTEHAENDGDGKCDYCYAELAASIAGNIYINLQDAIEALYTYPDINAEIKLLDDAAGSYTIDKGQARINLNGHKIESLLVKGNGQVKLCGDGTAQNLTFDGAEARFFVTALPILGRINISDGATWRSILPNRICGYKVYSDDLTAYKWYDSDAIGDYVGDGNSVNNVSVMQLPVVVEPELMLDKNNLAEESNISVYKDLEFSFKSGVVDGHSGKGVLFIQKEGALAPTAINASGDSDDYTCAPMTFDISEVGTYKGWAEVSKDGYTLRSKIHTLNVGVNLNDADITLKQTQFTYTPGTDAGATEFTAEIKSVSVTFTEKNITVTIPDDVYTVSGDKGTDAGEYNLIITAKEDSDYMDSATVTWDIIPCALVYEIVCRPKVYDGNTDAQIESIEFFTLAQDVKVALTENDYTIESIEYDSKNVGRNLGRESVKVNATVSLKGSAANNYVLALTGNTAYGYITPAPIDNIGSYHSYTYEVCYNDINAKSVTLGYFGAPDRRNCVIISDGVGEGYFDIVRTLSCDDDKFTFTIADGLGVGDVGKNYKVKLKIYTKDYNYCTGELFFTVKIADRGKPTLSVEPITTVYNGEPIPTDAIKGSATIDGQKIDGTWSFKDSKRPRKDAADSGDHTVTFTPMWPDYYYDADATVSITITPRDIGDENVSFTYGRSYVYNGNAIMPAILAKYGEKTLVEGTDYTVVYPADATNIGEKEIKIIGKGNFSGEATVNYSIEKNAAAPAVTLSQETFTYDGSAKEPSVTVIVEGRALEKGTDYDVAYSQNINAGNAAEVKITGKRNYGFSEVKKNFTINKAKIRVKPKDITKVYGDTQTFELVESSNTNLITAEELADLAAQEDFSSGGKERTAAANESGYDISVSLRKNETDNLSISVDGPGKLKVTKAPLTITVKNVSREYGAENPELEAEFNYLEFKNGEDESVLGGELRLSYDSDIDSRKEVGNHIGVTKAEGLTSNNYEITYVPGDVEITPIRVNVSAGTARSSYITAEFDRVMEGLAETNFIVTDSDGNRVAVTGVTESQDSRSYTLNGGFAVGKAHTVKVELSGSGLAATHVMATDVFVITPISSRRNNGGGSGSSGGTNGCTVSFEKNGGSRVLSRTVTENSAIKEPTEPTKEGYDFAGWYADEELKTKYDFSAKVTKNITLYAAWTEKDADGEDGKDADNADCKDNTDNTGNQIILTIGEKDAKVFGAMKSNDVAPKIVNDRTMLPARFVAENLGAEVSWNGEEKLVTIKGKNLKTGEDVTILITIGAKTAFINGREIELDSPAFIESDRTYTPVRFISEELGASVEWISEEQKVVITK